MSDTSITRRRAALGAAAMMLPGAATAQTLIRARPLLICAFPAGRRGRAQLLRREGQAIAGQTIIVENKPGAAGSIAAE